MYTVPNKKKKKKKRTKAFLIIANFLVLTATIMLIKT